MKTILSITIIFCLFIITSCDKQAIERNIISLNDVKLEHLKISETSAITELFNPSEINIVGKYIVMISIDATGPRTFYLYNKDNLKFLGSYISFGRSKKEVFFINPMYFYKTSDSTFLIHTNYFNETEYLIRNDSVTILNTNRITDVMPSGISRISENKHILYLSTLDSPDSEFEHTLQINDSVSRFNKMGMGVYPKFHNGSLDRNQATTLYYKRDITTEKSILSFYSKVPIIRKYDHNLVLQSEYILDDYKDYKIKNYNKLQSFYFYTKCYNSKIISMYNNNNSDEFLLFNDSCRLLRRFSIDQNPLSLPYCFDDEYFYFLNVREDPYLLSKVRYD